MPYAKTVEELEFRPLSTQLCTKGLKAKPEHLLLCAFNYFIIYILYC